MILAPIDYTRSRDNPWGLTPHQCAAMRLYCKYGNAKQAWAADEGNLKNIQSHVENARLKIGFRGHDMRSFVLWIRLSYDHDCDRVKKAFAYKKQAVRLTFDPDTST
jgi:hypothetical protein